MRVKPEGLRAYLQHCVLWKRKGLDKRLPRQLPIDELGSAGEGECQAKWGARGTSGLSRAERCTRGERRRERQRAGVPAGCAAQSEQGASRRRSASGGVKQGGREMRQALADHC